MVETNNLIKTDFKYKENVLIEAKDGPKVPKTIPTERCNNHLMLFGSFCAILTAITLFFKNIESFFIQSFFAVFSWCLLEFLYWLSLFLQEQNYLSSRYNGSWKILLADLLTFSMTFAMCFLSSLAFLITFLMMQNSSVWEFAANHNLNIVFCASIIGYFLNHLNMSSNPVVESIAMENNKLLDIGSHMALSYFHGYLKLLLPSNGDSEKGMLNYIRKYEARHKVKFIARKVFIFIPISLHCPANLVEQSRVIMTSSPLQEFEQNVAGVLNRSYKNQVYKILFDDHYFYVCAEYASCLPTLQKLLKGNDVTSAYYRIHKTDILYSFYKSLKSLLETDPEMKGLCKLVYYNDMVDGMYLDIGKILLKELNATLSS